jgi:hypothetical protein
VVRTVAILLALLVHAASAGAQSAPGVYLHGDLVLTRHSPGVPNHRIRPPHEGQGLGIAGSVGYRFDAEIALEGEVFFSGPISIRQGFYYNWTEEYILESRDFILSALIRWTPGRAPVEIVTGGGRVQTELRTHSGVRREMLSPVPRPLPETSQTSGAWSATAGADIPLGMRRAVQVVPGFRWRWTRRPFSQQYYGVGGQSLHFGIAVRAPF